MFSALRGIARTAAHRSLQHHTRSYHNTAAVRCGLVAFVSEKATARDVNAGIKLPHDPPAVSMPGLMQHALHTLEHRGPDHIGSWTSADGSIGLGHTRLAILDLHPSGNQPMTNEDASVRAVVNGEIYDWEKQKAHLQALGCRFNSKSDRSVDCLSVDADFERECGCQA
jgi:asparagine synthetase B (glutamine-hydrolysing)